MTADPRIAILREGLIAWEQGDWETAIQMIDPKIEVYAPPEVGNPGTFHGIDGFLTWTQAWYEAWETFQQDLLSLEPFGERHVVCKVMQHGVGKGSGIQVDRQATWVYELGEDRLLYMALFFDHDAALALAHEREASG